MPPKIRLISPVPAHQADSVLSQAAPVQNTWYTALDTTINVRLINIILQIDVAAEDLEVKITIDGQTLTGAQAGAVAGTNYYVHAGASAGSTALYLLNNIPTTYRSFLVEGRSIKVEARKTSANGAGTLICRVQYAKW